MEYGIDKVKLNNSKQKVEMFIRQESIIIDSINKQISKINSIINNNNADDIRFELINKLKIFKNNHYNNTVVFNKIIDKYEEVSRINTNLFNKDI